MKSIPMRQEGKSNQSIVMASHSHPALAGWWARPRNLPNRFSGFVAVPKPLKRLMSKPWPQTATQLKQGVNETGLPTISWRTKSLLVLLSLLILTACQNAASRSPEPLSAGALTEEYERSSAAVRSKYDGKEIIVRGYSLTAAAMPHEGHDQGSVWLEEKGRNASRQVACWFSRDQAEQFSQIKGAQYITVKGIFNGEAGVDLKFCKLVKVE
jgi:hypothetical protein